MRVGWLGLGAMGLPMATRLVSAGHHLVGYDPMPHRVGALAAAGGQIADSPGEAAKDTDVLAVMVATADQANEALFGRVGGAYTLSAGAVVLMMSTVGPDAVTAIADRLRESGISVVDAPVSGGAGRAATGELVFMVSGENDGVALVEDLVRAMASHASILGPTVGDGQRLKLVNQLLCGVHIAAAAEALAFAERMGLDARTCWETVRRGAAASFMLDDRGERMLQSAHDEVRSAMSIFVKDMGMVVDAARRGRLTVPVAGAAADLFLRGAQVGLGDMDDAALIDVVRGQES